MRKAARDESTLVQTAVETKTPVETNQHSENMEEEEEIQMVPVILNVKSSILHKENPDEPGRSKCPDVRDKTKGHYQTFMEIVKTTKQYVRCAQCGAESRPGYKCQSGQKKCMNRRNKRKAVPRRRVQLPQRAVAQ